MRFKSSNKVAIQRILLYAMNGLTWKVELDKQ